MLKKWQIKSVEMINTFSDNSLRRAVMGKKNGIEYTKGMSQKDKIAAKTDNRKCYKRQTICINAKLREAGHRDKSSCR